MQVWQVKIGDFQREAFSTQLGHKFITMSVHLTCSQQIRRDAAHCAGLSATVDRCYGHPMEQGRPLYFHPVVCSIFFLSFFSSPNLSRHRLDVCHTSIHGVALVRI